MKQCCEVTCDKPVMENSQLDCCEEHEEILKECLDEEYTKHQEDLYNDYVADVYASINHALLRTNS